MVKLTDQQIQDIADYLDSGMMCTVHKQTGELAFFPDEDDHFSLDREEWEAELSGFEDNPGDYLVFKRLSSSDSFGVMADFAESVDNAQLKSKLLAALDKRKPFRNFKDVIDCSVDYRQKWFDFKNQRNIERVKEQLAAYEADGG